jgi:hypothetical protein
MSWPPLAELIISFNADHQTAGVDLQPRFIGVVSASRHKWKEARRASGLAGRIRSTNANALAVAGVTVFPEPSCTILPATVITLTTDVSRESRMPVNRRNTTYSSQARVI